MFTQFHRKYKTSSCRAVSLLVSFLFAFNFVVLPAPSYAQGAAQPVLNLPAVGTMISTSQSFVPPTVNGITLDAENPLIFDFIIEQGDQSLSEQQIKEESEKLVRYFLAALTIPEQDLWVNLSPYEGGKVIPVGLGDTEMGRDLLAQDYLLKQLTASLMYPEEELGRKFWDKVFERAYQLYGKTNIPLNTFNKVWIVPDKAVIFEQGLTALVVESHLKVMLEEDYAALEYNRGDEKFGLNNLDKKDANEITDVTSKIVREVLIPAIEEEVNNGATFANLRQIYHSMVLATWYKKNLKDSLLGQVYVDQNKTKGIDTDDKEINQKIYNQYMEAFEKGVYNYIRHDYDKNEKRMVQRKYFSGGFKYNPRAVATTSELNNLRTPEQISMAFHNQDLIVRDMYQGDRGRFLSDMGTAAVAAGVNLKTVEQQVSSSPKPVRVKIELVENKQRGDAGVFSPAQYFRDMARAASPVYMPGISQTQATQQIAKYQESNVEFRAPNDDMTALVQRASDVVGLTNPVAIEIVNNTGMPTTFGAALSEDRSRMVVEDSFLKEIEAKGNPLDMKMRAFINVLGEAAGKTPLERKKAEYDQAMKSNPGRIQEIQNRLFNGAPIEQVVKAGTDYSMAGLTPERIAQNPALKGLDIIPAPQESIQPSRDTFQNTLYALAISQMNKGLDTGGSSYIRTLPGSRPLNENELNTPVTVAVIDATQGNLASTDVLARGLQTMAEKPEIGRLVVLVPEGNPFKDVSSHPLMRNLEPIVSVVPLTETDSATQKISDFARLNEGKPVNYLYDTLGQSAPAVFETDTEGKVVFTQPSEAVSYLNNPAYKNLTGDLAQSSDVLTRMSLAESSLVQDLAKSPNLGVFVSEYVKQNPDNLNIVPKLTPLGELALTMPTMPPQQNVGMMLPGGTTAAGDSVTRGLVAERWGPDQVYLTPSPGFAPPTASLSEIGAALTQLKLTGQLNAASLGTAVPQQTFQEVVTAINNDPSLATKYMPSPEPVQPVEILQKEGKSPGEIGQSYFYDLASNVQGITPATVIRQNVEAVNTNPTTGITEARLNIEVLPTNGKAMPTVTGTPVAEISYAISTTREGVMTFGAPEIKFAEEGVFSDLMKRDVMKELVNNYSQDLAKIGPASLGSSDLANATTSAANQRPAGDVPGGIDFNAAMLSLQIKRDGNGVPLPIKFQPVGEMNIEGFVPVILDIQTTPAAPGPLILGEAQTAEEELSRVAN